MEDKQILRQRMYHLVLYSLSGIQQGIQSYHAGIEYAMKYFNTPEFQQWAAKDKVVIILNGGTSNQTGNNRYNDEFCYGSMEGHLCSLIEVGIKHAEFYEPDLNNSMSAIAILVDEYVWDKDNHPDPDANTIGYNTLEDPDVTYYKKLVEMYGEKTAFLRTWLKKFRLA